MFWYHRSAMAQGEHRRADPPHPMTASQSQRLGWAQSRAEPGLVSQILALERDSGLRQASPYGKPELPACTLGSVRGHGSSTLCWRGRGGLTGLLCLFLPLLFGPRGRLVPVELGRLLSCLPTAALLVAIEATSALSSFLAFFSNFLFFFFSTGTGPWMADSWRMSEADTAASRQRCNSSPSSLLPGRVGGVLVGLGMGPQSCRALPQARPPDGGQGETAVCGELRLGQGQTWVPT